MRIRLVATTVLTALVAGSSNPECDDGVTDAELDLPEGCQTPDSWESCPEWTCQEKWMTNDAGELQYIKPQALDRGGHKCRGDDRDGLYPNAHYPNGIPVSGYHSPEWSAYGEYLWVPPLRYVHALEHGAVVFMYHPCTPEEQVSRLRTIATSCLWKHLIFAFRGDLNQTYPMALVSWANLVKIPMITDQNSAAVKIWVKEHAKIGGNGEGRIFGNGKYNLTLLKPAEVVTVVEDSEICPETEVDQEETIKKAIEILKSNETPIDEIKKMIDEAPEVSNITTAIPIEIPVTTQEASVTPRADLANMDPPINDVPSFLENPVADEVVSQEPDEVVDEETLEVATNQGQTEHFDDPSDFPKIFKTENSDFSTTTVATAKPLTTRSKEEDESLETEIRQSGEPLWAFLSLSILIIGLIIAIRRSKMFERKSPRKNYMNVQDTWSDDEGAISVGTLVRGFRRKSNDEQSYSLLKKTDEP